MKRRKPLSLVSARHLRRLSKKHAQESPYNSKYDEAGAHCSGENLDGSSEKSSCPLINSGDSEEISESNRSTSDTSSSEDICLTSSSELFISDDEIDDISSSNDDDDGDDDEQIHDVPCQVGNEESSLSNDLVFWAIKHGITLAALSGLLSTLTKHGHNNLPKDARTLLKTPRNVIVRKIAPGEYWHSGLEKGLCNILSQEDVRASNPIELVVNIDGLPLSNSSQSSLWPILGSVFPTKKVFIIGMYHGQAKPSSANDFLKEFVEEMKTLSECGFYFKDQLLKVNIKCFVFDAPAKSFALMIKGHGGYSSCTKCHVEGESVENRICFADINSLKRTHDNFRLRTDQEFHMGETSSILLDIPGIDLVTNVPLDYMHLICLGVVRKLLYLWLGAGKKTVRLQSRDVKLVSNNLEELKNCVPEEFARKPRSLNYVKQWKATELRQFLLYTGTVVLRNVLSKEIYLNFLTLSVSVRILCSRVHHHDYADYSDYLLRKFLKKFIDIYGEHQVSHNVHGLIHLVDDTKKFGVLDNYSAFPFENYMQVLKKLVRKSEKPLQQLCKRYTEIENIETVKSSVNDNAIYLLPHHEGPLTDNCQHDLQYKKIKISKNCELNVTSNSNNCCIMHDGTVVRVKNISFANDKKCYVIVGYAFIYKEDFFTKPCQSSIFDVYTVSHLSKSLKCWSTNEIKSKGVIFPVEKKFVVFPLLHSEN